MDSDAAVSMLLRQYKPDELLLTGYPWPWEHGTTSGAGTEDDPLRSYSPIKDIVRRQAGHRCVRCGHPYRSGEHGTGEWSPCDEQCTHQDDAPVRVVDAFGNLLAEYRAYNGGLDIARAGWLADDAPVGVVLEAKWRILTVHHLGEKADCRWFMLAALCQRCHLTIQGRVKMRQLYVHPHSTWFKPYAAGYYASTYLGEELTRDETIARLDELLALELDPSYRA